MRLLLAALLLIHGAAMGQTFACQYVAAGGLHWQNDRWEPTRFQLQEPFFLKITSGQIDTDLVEKALDPEIPDNLRSSALRIPTSVKCFKNNTLDPRTIGTDPSRHKYIEQHTCSDEGAVVIFRPALRMGVVARLSGGLAGPRGPRQYRDTLSVGPFTCQQM
jgi:hypothetical protein